MKRLKFLYRPILAVLLVAFTLSCDDDDEIFIAPNTNTILDAVLADANFTTLRDAVVRANLESTLSNPTTQLTVFAPDNDAFDAYFQNSTAFNSVNDVPVDVLRNLILNHVVAGEVTSSMLSTGYVKTQGENSTGDNLDVFVNVGNQILVNDALVDNPNIQVDNGIIHVVDAVVDFSTVLSIAALNDDFSNLEAAIAQQSPNTLFGLGDMSATFTVFAPSNASFQALIDEDPNDGLSDINDVLGLSNLTDVLTYHVVSGAAVREAGIMLGTPIDPIGPGTFTINMGMNNPEITDANGRTVEIVATDVTGINGVVHVINNVILP